MRAWRSRLAEGAANDRTSVHRAAGGSGVAVRAGGRAGTAADAGRDETAETHGGSGLIHSVDGSIRRAVLPTDFAGNPETRLLPPGSGATVEAELRGGPLRAVCTQS